MSTNWGFAAVSLNAQETWKTPEREKNGMKDASIPKRSCRPSNIHGSVRKAITKRNKFSQRDKYDDDLRNVLVLTW